MRTDGVSEEEEATQLDGDDGPTSSKLMVARHHRSDLLRIVDCAGLVEWRNGIGGITHNDTLGVLITAVLMAEISSPP